MIDIHTHTVHGVDDGATDLAESLAMLSMAADDGITTIVATPHADLRYKFDPAYCRTELERLREQCGGRVRLHLGCELHLTPENISRVLNEPASYTLNGRGCILLELPDNITPPPIDAAVEALLSARMQVIVAHPERNLFLQRDWKYAKSLVDAGCYMQLTAQSLLGGFGSGAERFAAHLIKSRLVHFVASDGHGAEHRRPLLSAAYQEVVRRCGEATARILFVDNPAAALAGNAIQRIPSSSQSIFASILRTHVFRNRSSQIPAVS